MHKYHDLFVVEDNVISDNIYKKLIFVENEKDGLSILNNLNYKVYFCAITYGTETQQNSNYRSLMDRRYGYGPKFIYQTQGALP